MFLTRRPITALSSSNGGSDPALKHKHKPMMLKHQPRKFHQPHLPHVENVSIAVYPKPASAQKWKIVSMALASLLIGQFLYSVFGSVRMGNVKTGECLLSFGTYMGNQYKAKETVGRKCLIESKWMRIQQHQVQFEGDPTSILDWLWIDYHDRVNVLVEAPPVGDERQFYVLERSKYSFEGRTSWAIVSGTINKGERHEIAAAREVEAEMNLKCDEIHILGRFRTDVNRGMGWVTSYLASQCKPLEGVPVPPPGERRLTASPSERNDLRIVSLDELRDSTQNGAFIDVQWSNTVAMALLHPELASAN